MLVIAKNLIGMNQNAEQPENEEMPLYSDDAYKIAQLAVQLFQAGCKPPKEDLPLRPVALLGEAVYLLCRAEAEKKQHAGFMQQAKQSEDFRRTVIEFKIYFDGDKIAEKFKGTLGQTTTRSGFEKKLTHTKIEDGVLREIVKIVKMDSGSVNGIFPDKWDWVIIDAFEGKSKRKPASEFHIQVLRDFVELAFLRKGNGMDLKNGNLRDWVSFREKRAILESDFITRSELELLDLVKTE